MSRRKKILIAAAVILIMAILALLYYLLFLRPKQGAAPGTVPPSTANENAAPPSPLALPTNALPAAPQKVSDEEKMKSDLGRLAAAFSERFGSYSNQGEFENILDLKPLMTKKMQDWADDFIAKSKAARGNTSVYFGVTTKAVSTNISELSEGDGRAKVTVKNQRREASGTMADNVKIYYQELDLVFLKVGDEWKVNEATWK